ncbi:MAG: hypothetical protein VKS61_12620 [Candidatus Sericytochromatia bacterium]|nr:hypothetical protein [Candidatus Sericytochromatia bacterium]
MTVRGRVVLPPSLVGDAGGALVSNGGGRLLARGGGLVSDHGGSLISDRGGGLISDRGASLMGTGSERADQARGRFALLSLEEQPVSGLAVVLADARGVVFRSLPAGLTDADGAFEIPKVPRGLAYTVQAGLQTPNGELRLASLVASDKPVTLSVASTLVVEALKRPAGDQWGSLDQAAVERATTRAAQALQPEDALLAFAAKLAERQAQVLQRLKGDVPELGPELDALASQAQQVPPGAQAIAAELRRRPAVAPTPTPQAPASPSLPGAATVTPSPTPGRGADQGRAGSASPAPSLSPTPSPLTTLAPSPTPAPSPSPVASPTPRVYTVATLAGSTPGSLNGTGGEAQFRSPTGLAVDGSGNVFVADRDNHLIRKVTPAGVVSVLAGSTQGNTNGTGVAAQFNSACSVAVDDAGNVYVADRENETIRKVSPAGVATTLAGSTQGTADGTGAAAQFFKPTGVGADGAGNVYVADWTTNRIRKVTPAGVVTTLAGGTGGAADGTGAAAQFNQPAGAAVDAAGNVYVSDLSNHRIRKVSPAGVVTTLAGSTRGFADGTGAAAQFNIPVGLAVDGAGNVYVADRDNHRIRKVSPDGEVTTLAGSTPGAADGPLDAAQFNQPAGVALDRAGNLYVADQSNHRIRKIDLAP